MPTGAEHATPARNATFDIALHLVRAGAVIWTGGGTSTRRGAARVAISGGVAFGPGTTRGRLTFAARLSGGGALAGQPLTQPGTAPCSRRP